MAKKKYIDVYKYREDFYNDVLSILSDDATNDRANEIIDVFDSLPAADVQEVVRCKDCAYYIKSTAYNGYLCGKALGLYGAGAESYCSYGARMDGKDGEENGKKIC